MTLQYLSLIFLVAFSVMGIDSVFADHMEITVEMATGSGSPGCEKLAGCYLPFYTKIDSGSTVIFLNTDSAAHTVTSGTPSDGPDGNFDTGLLMARNTSSVTLDEVREYPYFCMVHPWMEGTIIVENSSTESNSKCDAGTVFDEVSNSCVLEGSKISNESNSKCGAGTVFDDASNSCVLITQPTTKNIEVEKEIFEFDIRRDKYSAKEPIFIDGYVKYIKYPSHINIRISEVGGKLVENVYVLPGKDNYFFYNTKSLPSWEIPSTYSVKVTYDNKSEVKYFDLVIRDKNYDPNSVKSLQGKLASLRIDNLSLQQKITQLEELLSQTEKKMDNMFCYKLPT